MKLLPEILEEKGGQSLLQKRPFTVCETYLLQVMAREIDVMNMHRHHSLYTGYLTSSEPPACETNERGIQGMAEPERQTVAILLNSYHQEIAGKEAELYSHKPVTT